MKKNIIIIGLLLAVSGMTINASLTNWKSWFSLQGDPQPKQVPSPKPKQQEAMNRDVLMLELRHLQSLPLIDRKFDFENKLRHLQSLRIEDEIQKTEERLKELKRLLERKISIEQRLRETCQQIARQEELEMMLQRD